MAAYANYSGSVGQTMRTNISTASGSHKEPCPQPQRNTTSKPRLTAQFYLTWRSRRERAWSATARTNVVAGAVTGCSYPSKSTLPHHIEDRQAVRPATGWHGTSHPCRGEVLHACQAAFSRGRRYMHRGDRVGCFTTFTRCQA